MPLVAAVDSVVVALAWAVAVGAVAVASHCGEEVMVTVPYCWQRCPLILPSVAGESVGGGAVGVGSVPEAALFVGAFHCRCPLILPSSAAVLAVVAGSVVP